MNHQWILWAALHTSGSIRTGLFKTRRETEEFIEKTGRKGLFKPIRLVLTPFKNIKKGSK